VSVGAARAVLRRIAIVTVPALAVAVVVAALGVEVWVRRSWNPLRGQPGFYVTDAVRGQRLAANYSGWFAGVPVHINRLGMRDPREYALAKAPNTFRILVLGDSVTFGHGSVYEHTYPYLLEQRLKAWRPDVDWQVMNAAVPGYNTTQELSQLLEIGPTLQPDLVIVGFYENDVIDNNTPPRATVARRAAAAAISFARRHVYSLELYKRLYYEAAWRLAPSDAYRNRIATLGDQLGPEQLEDVSHSPAQQLTPYDWRSDAEVRSTFCYDGMKPSVDAIRAIERNPTYPAWASALEQFAALERRGTYRLVFFLNIVPPACPGTDVFYDGTALLNAYYMSQFSRIAPTVSCHDAFLHVRPSQMPNANAHATGNSNAVKADVLFNYVRAEVLPPLLSAPHGGESSARRR